LSGFLSLFHAWVPAEETLGLQGASQIRIDLKESPRNSQLRRASLSNRATRAGIIHRS